MVSEIDLQDWETGPLTRIQDLENKSYFEDPWSGSIMKLDFIKDGFAVCMDLNGVEFAIDMMCEVLPLKEKM